MTDRSTKGWGWLKPNIQFIDIFGKKVSLTVKGEETYHSALSIITSGVFLLTMAVYSIFLITQNVKDPIKSLSYRSRIDISNLSSNQSDHAIDFFSADLNLGFGFTEDLPPGIGRFKASFKSKTRNDEGKLTEKWEKLEMTDYVNQINELADVNAVNIITPFNFRNTPNQNQAGIQHEIQVRNVDDSQPGHPNKSD